MRCCTPRRRGPTGCPTPSCLPPWPRPGVTAVATVAVGVGAEPFLALADEARAMR